MPYVTVGRENSSPIEVYYEDHGSGQPIVMIHGFPYGGSSWEKQLGPVLAAGYRAITYDRRGFHHSSQPTVGYDYDTFAADLDILMHTLDLHDAILVGHSMGTGEVIRYLSRYGSNRVDKAVVVSPLAPFLLKTPDNPEGVDGSLFEGFKKAVVEDRFAYLTSFGSAFFSWDDNKGTRVSEEAFRAHWNVGAQASGIATLRSIDAWLTDFRPDLADIDVPLLIIHGDADAVLPYDVTAKRLAPMVPGSKLITLRGAPHGIPWTHPAEVNQAILEFAKMKTPVSAGR